MKNTGLKRSTAGLLALALLSGCASQQTRDALAWNKVRCTQGDSLACNTVGGLQAQADQEASDNAGRVALGVIAIPLLVALVALGASPDFGPGPGPGHGPAPHRPPPPPPRR